VAELLETAFQDARYGVRIPLQIDDFYVILAADGTGKQWKSKSSLPKNVRRGYDGRELTMERTPSPTSRAPPVANLIDFDDSTSMFVVVVDAFAWRGSFPH
jgi:hypothetical protein